MVRNGNQPVSSSSSSRTKSSTSQNSAIPSIFLEDDLTTIPSTTRRKGVPLETTFSPIQNQNACLHCGNDCTGHEALLCGIMGCGAQYHSYCILPAVESAKQHHAQLQKDYVILCPKCTVNQLKLDETIRPLIGEDVLEHLKKSSKKRRIEATVTIKRNCNEMQIEKLRRILMSASSEEENPIPFLKDILVKK